MRRIPIWAAENSAGIETATHADPGPSFRDRLEEAGFTAADLEGLEVVLEREAADRALNLAAGFVRELSGRLRFESAARAAPLPRADHGQ